MCLNQDYVYAKGGIKDGITIVITGFKITLHCYDSKLRDVVNYIDFCYDETWISLITCVYAALIPPKLAFWNWNVKVIATPPFGKCAHPRKVQ